MNLYVTLVNAGAVDKAMERVEAARRELNEAVMELGRACSSVCVEVKEAARAANADGDTITP